MADNKEKKDAIKTPQGNELKAVEKKNFIQKTGDKISEFADKHQKGIKWAKRGILAATGVLLFGAGCKVGGRNHGTDENDDAATAEEIIDVFTAPDETTEADNN